MEYDAFYSLPFIKSLLFEKGASDNITALVINESSMLFHTIPKNSTDKIPCVAFVKCDNLDEIKNIEAAQQGITGRFLDGAEVTPDGKIFQMERDVSKYPRLGSRFDIVLTCPVPTYDQEIHESICVTAISVLSADEKSHQSISEMIMKAVDNFSTNSNFFEEIRVQTEENTNTLYLDVKRNLYGKVLPDGTSLKVMKLEGLLSMVLAYTGMYQGVIVVAPEAIANNHDTVRAAVDIGIVKADRHMDTAVVVIPVRADGDQPINLSEVVASSCDRLIHLLKDKITKDL